MGREAFSSQLKKKDSRDAEVAKIYSKNKYICEIGKWEESHAAFAPQGPKITAKVFGKSLVMMEKALTLDVNRKTTYKVFGYSRLPAHTGAFEYIHSPLRSGRLWTRNSKPCEGKEWWGWSDGPVGRNTCHASPMTKAQSPEHMMKGRSDSWKLSSDSYRHGTLVHAHARTHTHSLS